MINFCDALVSGFLTFTCSVYSMKLFYMLHFAVNIGICTIKFLEFLKLAQSIHQLVTMKR
uniref:Uncharacterized protein n=1 Tax=Arundo donax TaxID=35708 RepID=A0A0A9E2E9_ARUDO